jgi:hypothetical protein
VVAVAERAGVSCSAPRAGKAEEEGGPNELGYLAAARREAGAGRGTAAAVGGGRCWRCAIRRRKRLVEVTHT